MDIAGVFRIVRNMQEVVEPNHALYDLIANTLHSIQNDTLLEQELDQISAAAANNATDPRRD